MPRLRLFDKRHALTVGAGVSGGECTSQSPDLCPGCGDGSSTSTNPTYPTYYTLWANLEAGGELWTSFGLAFRYFVGFAHGTRFGSPPAAASSYLSFPYLGLGLGYAF
jgi:hypothetical protein